MFTTILRVLKQGYEDTDKVTVTMTCPTMVKTISTNLVSVAQLTPAMLFTRIYKVLQSNNSLLSNTFTVRATFVRQPGGNYLSASARSFIASLVKSAGNQGYVMVENKDEFCLLHALAIG